MKLPGSLLSMILKLYPKVGGDLPRGRKQIPKPINTKAPCFYWGTLILSGDTLTKNLPRKNSKMYWDLGIPHRRRLAWPCAYPDYILLDPSHGKWRRWPSRTMGKYICVRKCVLFTQWQQNSQGKEIPNRLNHCERNKGWRCILAIDSLSRGQEVWFSAPQERDGAGGRGEGG